MTTQRPAAQPMPMFEEIAEAEPAVLIQGLARGRIIDFGAGPGCPIATVERCDDPPERTDEADIAMTTVLEQVETYLGMMPNVPEEVLMMVRGVEEPGWLADLIA